MAYHPPAPDSHPTGVRFLYLQPYAKFQFIEQFEICTNHLPLPLGEVPPKGVERAVGFLLKVQSS